METGKRNTATIMETKITVRIKLWGIVQGVGFRPFAAKLADRLGMKGEVLNMGGLVDITVTDTPKRIDLFLETLQNEKPAPAEIIHIKKEQVPYRTFSEFQIVASTLGEDEAAMIPADLSVCATCLAELYDGENPRQGHPFISCMECGPRFTIMDKMPYDRKNTAMDEFPMCNLCDGQYKDRDDRRYHAQTVSCHSCGPQLVCRDLNGNISGDGVEGKGTAALAKEMITWAAQNICQGKVIAVKGVGGYNLLCDPFCADAVQALRNVKGREEKPFAVMFRDMDQIREFCLVNPVEENLLTSSAKPILLLEKKRGRSCPEFEKSQFIGAFLPSMGLHHLLLTQLENPLIVTSANRSGMPMIKEEEGMFSLADQSDGKIEAIYFHTRKIRVGVDDSVVRVIDGQPQMIRRAKGYAPVPLYLAVEKPISNDVMMLACGGQLKSAFALSKGAFSYVSQYLGDMDTLENCRIFEENVNRMKTFFAIEPKLILCDLHPLYETTKYARRYARQHGVQLVEVQHHHAHVASVMAEHGLCGSVIGVSFDGTGYGTDGAIWGGEFLICKGSRFERHSHLQYIRMPGGDVSMKQAWKAAMAYVYAYKDRINQACAGQITVELSDILAFSNIRQDERWPVVKKVLDGEINTVESSSMGRLFDAVAALLGIGQENRYEGECAMLLEAAATRAQAAPGQSKRDDLALTFHCRIATMILKQCMNIREQRGISNVALTGGVFQNKILMEQTLALLREENFSVYYNISVSPNDGGIALGQNYIGICRYLQDGHSKHSAEGKIE